MYRVSSEQSKLQDLRRATPYRETGLSTASKSRIRFIRPHPSTQSDVHEYAGSGTASKGVENERRVDESVGGKCGGRPTLREIGKRF